MTEDPFANHEKRHTFFLNPYEDMAFTRCPKCEQSTRLRKFCLIIHAGPQLFVSFNKSCRFCPACDLLIAQKSGLEAFLATLQQKGSRPIGEFHVMGSMDRKLHRKGKTKSMSAIDALDAFWPFKNYVSYEVDRGGWGPA